MTDARHPGRRELVYADVSEIMPDVYKLRNEHRTAGNWTLAQICRHLTDSVAGSMNGFGVKNHRIMRLLFGRRALADVFAGGMGAGFTVTEKLTPPPDLDLDDAIEGLARMIDRYMSHAGPLHFHPFFGHMSRQEWDRMHCVHCAHHLSFAIPNTQ